jgi:hypothetical protein
LEIKYFNIGASTYFWHTRQTWLARVTISTRNTPLTRLQVLALAKFARVAIPYLKVKKLTKAGMKSIHNIFRRLNLKTNTTTNTWDWWKDLTTNLPEMSQTLTVWSSDAETIRSSDGWNCAHMT